MSPMKTFKNLTFTAALLLTLAPVLPLCAQDLEQWTNDRSRNPRKGGLVSTSAAVQESVYLATTAKILDSASVQGAVRIYGNAVVSGEAFVKYDYSGTAEENLNIYGNALVTGNASVKGAARIYGSAQISGNANVSGNPALYENAEISGSAIVKDKAIVCGNAIVGGTAIIGGDAIIRGYARIYSGTYTNGVVEPPEPAEEIAARNARIKADADAQSARVKAEEEARQAKAQADQLRLQARFDKVSAQLAETLKEYQQTTFVADQELYESSGYTQILFKVEFKFEEGRTKIRITYSYKNKYEFIGSGNYVSEWFDPIFDAEAFGWRDPVPAWCGDFRFSLKADLISFRKEKWNDRSQKMKEESGKISNLSETINFNYPSRLGAVMRDITKARQQLGLNIVFH